MALSVDPTDPRLKLDEHEKQIREEIRERQGYLRDLRGIRKKFSRALPAEYVMEKKLQQRARGIAPIWTGVPWWDQFAGPFRRGNSYVLAGYPGTGKTTAALNLAWSMAQRGETVWYYCLELTADEVFEVVGGHILKKDTLTEADETLVYSTIQPTGFRFFEPEQYMPWNEHIELICRTVEEDRIGFVVIDNLSYLTRVSKNSYEIENVSSARIKSLSQELEIPILLIHHLRKPDKDDSEPEPTAHTMRGSGAILGDASDAFILHHPLTPDDEDRTRHPVGYITSGKPRWRSGGRRYVRLVGTERTYYPATAMEYPRKKRKREREFE